MGKETVFCFLAALGIVLLGWSAFGYFLLPMRHSMISVYVLQGEESSLEHQIRCWLWLRFAGFAAGSLLLLDIGAEATAVQIAKQFTIKHKFVYYVNIQREMEFVPWNERRS